MGSRLHLAVAVLVLLNLAAWGLNSYYGAQFAGTPMASSSKPQQERGVRGSAGANAQNASPVVSGAGGLDKELCKQLGPFNDAGSASALGNRLKSLGLKVSVQKKAVSAPAGYWLLAPVVDAAAGRELAAKLNEIPMRDWQVLRNSPYGVAVSMGLFNVRSAAEVRLKQVRAVAPSALIYAKQQSKSQYWIQATGAGKVIMAESGAAKVALECDAN